MYIHVHRPKDTAGLAMNIPNTSHAPRAAPELATGLIEALRVRRDRVAQVAADNVATLARHKAQKQGVKALWANVAKGRAPKPGEPFRSAGLIRPAHEISDEEFDRQVSDILDRCGRASRFA
jgi:hypothetical protein